MQTRRATRVLAAKRRGSSWPVVVETDGGRFFTKLRGAGHGPAALVAEVIAGALADETGLRAPARVLVRIDAGLVSEDQDPELLELLARSHGLNLGFELLEGARDLRPEDVARVACDEASSVAWLDWLVMNPDRTRRNPNLMLRRNRLWLIDHGAALTFHHDWRGVSEDSPRRAPASLAAHALAERATSVADWDELLGAALGRGAIRAAVELVPDGFLAPLLPATARTAGALTRRREAYVAFLWKRLKPPRPLAGGPPAG
jgi:hypothetical protein